jgi:predicted Holliday junction resolvase-like endonuclease
LGAAVLNPWDKKERKDSVAQRCYADLNLWEKKEKNSAAQRDADLREAAIGQELAVAVGVLGERIGYRGI